MAAVAHAGFGASNLYHGLDPVELVTLYGCLTRAREEVWSESGKWNNSEERTAEYRTVSTEIAIQAKHALEALVWSLRDVTTVSEYGYDCFEMAIDYDSQDV